jgi:GAF domain-containing protein
MRQRQRTRFTLANRLLALSALIVLATTLLLSATTFVGVYAMANRQVSARQSAYRDILMAEIGGRLNISYGVVCTTAEQKGIKGDEVAEYRRVLSASGLENAQHLHGFALVGADGTLLQEWPSGIGADIPPGKGVTDGPFVWDKPSAASRTGTLWIAAPVDAADGTVRTLWARVRVEFVGQELAHIAISPGAPIALVFDAGGTPVFAGGVFSRIEGSVFEFLPDEEHGARGSVRAIGDSAYTGHYGDLTTPPGLGWRVGVMEPSSRAMTEAWQAMQSGVLGWVLALVFATGASLVMVGRVTRPLRELEQRARALASGSSPEQETVDEYDEVARLLDAVNTLGRRLDRVRSIAELLARSTDLTQVLEGVTTSIAHMLDVEDVDVLLLADDGQLELVAAQGSLADRLGIRVELSDVPWISRSIADGQSIEVPGDAADPLLALHDAPGAVAVSTPLRAGEDMIGVVAVLRRDGRAFTTAEIETVRSFAAQASVALRNSRLFERERRSRRDEAALNAIAGRVTSPVGLQDTLSEVATTAAALLGYDAGFVVLSDRSAFGLPPSESSESDAFWFGLWERQHGGDEAVPLVIGMGEREAQAELPDGRPAELCMIVPLSRGGVLAGLLVLLSVRDRMVTGERTIALADTVGKQLSLALDNAYLYEETRSRADNMETIFRISHAVASSLQSRVVLNRVLDVVQKILSADAVMLMTYDAARKTMTVPMARGILHRDMLEATFRPGEDVPGRVFETREPERFDRIASADTRLLNAAAAQGLSSLLAVPLLARGKSIGVLAVFARAEAAFSTDELDLLRTFASQAALAIDTAALFSREHHVATVLQESILPSRLPRVEGIESASVYLPAGTDVEIGGDYFDLFEAPDGRVVVSMGDVCGKGVEAATKTSMIKYAIRGMAVAGLGPARVLEELNRMLVASGDAMSIVTLWLGYLDIGTLELLYADGGHPPGLLLRADDRRIERLSTTGALLGAVGDATWSEHRVAIPPGSTLLLYTDGVTEARSGGRFFGEGRVRRALRAGGTAGELAERLIATVKRFSAGELRDDAAILALVCGEATGPAARVTPPASSGM